MNTDIQTDSDKAVGSGDLLGCPFCGQAPEVTDESSDEIKQRDDARRALGEIVPGNYLMWNTYYLRVMCRKCGFGFDVSLTDAVSPILESEIKTNRANLLKKWNTRKQPNNAICDPSKFNTL